MYRHGSTLNNVNCKKCCKSLGTVGIYLSTQAQDNTILHLDMNICNKSKKYGKNSKQQLQDSVNLGDKRERKVKSWSFS